MTSPGQPDQPWQLQLKPEEWQNVLRQAMGDLRTNPHDKEALSAIRDANEALGVYDQAEAASPGERIRAGVEGGLTGLGHVPGDILHGAYQTVRHPIQTALNLPKIPGQLAAGLTSNDPEQVGRTVGNIGGMVLPFAKTTRAAGAPTVAGAIGRAVTTPLRYVRGKAITAEAAAEGQLLKNQLLRGRVERMGRSTSRAESPAPRAQQLPVRGEVRAGPPKSAGDFLRQATQGIVDPEEAAAALRQARGDLLRQKIASGELPDQTPSPRIPPDPLDTPTFQRRAGSPQQDAAVMQRALQRNSWSTRQMPGGKPAPSARAQAVSQAADQIANLTTEELQAAKGMAGGNRQLLSLINRELKRRAGGGSVP